MAVAIHHQDAGGAVVTNNKTVHMVVHVINNRDGLRRSIAQIRGAVERLAVAVVDRVGAVRRGEVLVTAIGLDVLSRRDLGRVRTVGCRWRSGRAGERRRSRQHGGAGARRGGDAGAAIGDRKRARNARRQRQTCGVSQGQNRRGVQIWSHQDRRIGEHQISRSGLIDNHRGQVGAGRSLQERRDARAQTRDAGDGDVGRSGGVARGVLVERREVSGNCDGRDASAGRVLENTCRQRRQSLTVDPGDGRG